MKSQGQRVLITDAARGIGAEAAQQLAAQGATLAPIGAISQFFMSPLREFIVKRKARVAVPKVEAVVVAMGCSFGASSMGHALTAKK